MAVNNTFTHYCAAIIIGLIIGAHCDTWRTDPEYEPWTMAGKFLLGTPPTCVKPPAPQDGRWVCSYSEGVNGRSLCILDCKRDYVIEGRPLIFNCVNGAWKMFPIPITHIERPWGTCIPIEIYRAQMSMEDAKRAIGTERRKATNSDNNNGYTSKRSGALSNALKEIDLAKYF